MILLNLNKQKEEKYMTEVQSIIDKNKEVLVIPDGIAVISKDMKIIVFNEAASRITGFQDEEIIDRDCDLLFKKCKYEMRYITEALNDDRTFTNLSINITDKNGTIKNVLASLTPIRKDNNVLSLVFVFRDTREMLKQYNQSKKIIKMMKGGDPQ